MKISLFTLLFLCSISLLQAQNVNIPDANFKAALVADVLRVNTNGDSEIQLSEAQACLVVSVNNKGITDLTGIEEFINVGGVAFDDNAVTTADLSALTKMSLLYCRNNQLTSLLIPTNNTALTFLYAQNNQLTSLDLTNALDTLRELNLSYNQLTSIDLSSLDVYSRRVTLDHNQLTDIVFPSSGFIPFVTCSHNQLPKLRVTVSFSHLDCSNNPMDSLWAQGTSGFGNRLECDSNQLTYINILDVVDTMICSHNLLTELSRNGNDGFRYLDCSYNSLDSVRITYPSLRYLDISHNQLDRLIVLANSANNIFPLDATDNPNLECIRTNDANIANALSNWTIDNQTSIFENCTGIWSSVSPIDALYNVHIYPNPTTASVYLDLGQLYEQVNVVVYNSIGQILNVHQKEQTQQLEVALPDTKGIYLVKVKTEQGQAIFNVIKE